MNQRRTFLQGLVALFGLGATTQADCLGSICSLPEQRDRIPGFRLLDEEKEVKVFDYGTRHNITQLYYDEVSQITNSIHTEFWEYTSRTTITSVFTNLKGEKHRDNGPAETYIHVYNGVVEESYEYWYQNGLFHRDGDNPAIIGHCVSDHYTYGLPSKRGPSGWASSLSHYFEPNADGTVDMSGYCGDTFDQPYKHWFVEGRHIKSEVWMGSCDYTEDLKPIICPRSLRMVEPKWFD